MLSHTLLLASVRFFRRHPWQLWLTLLSIALGTAVVVAVDLANATATRSFRASVTELSGPMTHSVKASEGWLSGDVYVDLRRAGFRKAVPQLSFNVSLDGRALTLTGVDPVAMLDLPTLGGPMSSMPVLDLMTPGTAALSSALARELGVKKGDKLTVLHGGRPRTLTLLATLEAVSPSFGNLLLADLSTVQEVAGVTDQLSEILLQLEADEASQLAQRLPPQARLTSFDEQKQAFEAMTEAFRVNLAAMSLLAMLVGAFLVYNTMTFSVLQRRSQFAVARMVGVEGRQLFLHLLLDAFVLGIAGAVLGLLLGWGLGQGLLVLVGRTVNDLYHSVEVGHLQWSWWLMLKAVAMTMAAVIVATLAPAYEAAKVPPVLVRRASRLEQHGVSRLPSLFLVGLVVLAMSWGTLTLTGESLVAGFTGLFLFIVGYSLLMPLVLLRMLDRLARWLARAGLLPRLAVRGIRSALSRTSLAMIALSVAVSATVGVSIMIGSFRSSVADWLEQTLSSDVYISAAEGSASRVDGTLKPFWREAVAELPQVSAVSSGRSITLRLDGQSYPALVLEPAAHSERGFRYREGDAREVWSAFVRGDGLLVSEPLAYHRHLQTGGQVAVETALGGELRMPVLGVYQDYSSGQGMVVMSRVLYEQYWRDRERTSLGLTLADGADEAVLKRRLQSIAADHGDAVMIRSNIDIRNQSLAVFDRTFAVTQVLRVLVIIVAFVGVFSALMALFLEKTREYSILRASGMTPASLARLIALQAGMMGLIAGFLAMPLGWIMSQILIEVINRRSFGWTMEALLPPAAFIEAVVLSLMAALLAAWLPARRIAAGSLRAGLQS